MAVSLKPVAEQVIVITGASSGIGLATARRAAVAGAKLVLAARNGPALEKIAAEITAQGGRAVAVATDVGRKEEVERLAARAIEAFGGFDTWVNDAGLGLFGRIAEVADEDHRQMFEINYWGLVYGSKAAYRHLRTKGGAIINLGSVASDMAFPIQGLYCASKHAIKGFTDALRLEIEEAGDPISVTLIKPAAIDTPFPEHAKNDMSEEPKLPPPVYRPEDVAAAIVHAAAHGGRDYYIGGGSKLMSSLNKHFPSAVDRLAGSRMAVRQQLSGGPPDRPRAGALYSAGRDGSVRGDSPHLVRHSLYTRATMHPVVAGALLTAAALTGAALFNRRRASDDRAFLPQAAEEGRDAGLLRA